MSGSQDSLVPTNDQHHDYSDLTPRTAGEVVGPQRGRAYGTRCRGLGGVLRVGGGRGAGRRGRRWFLPLRNEVVVIRHRSGRVGGRGVVLPGLWYRKSGLCLVGGEVDCLVLLWGPGRSPGEFLQINNCIGDDVPGVLRM